MQFTPYVLGSTRRGGSLGGTETDSDAGFDVKYSVTPSLTLDPTYNTDFAQVEADEQQLNLDRFALFFPEKRPFFLENAGQFGVGNGDDSAYSLGAGLQRLRPAHTERRVHPQVQPHI